MIVKDLIYGERVLHRPEVVLEILKEPCMKRLKGVNQAGYFTPFYEGATDTRWDHSLGVYLLLDRFGAELPEKVAGLIHDVSHSCFSHCIDYVFEEGSGKTHNYQDNVFLDYVRSTNIPAIIKKHNFRLKHSADHILDESNFPLLETELPDLCADRIDYSLRCGIIYKEVDQKQVDHFLDSLYIDKNLSLIHI